MVWYAQNNQLKLAGGNSGLRPMCIPTLAGFFIGDSTMKRIPLTRGQYALVDDADFAWLNQFKWYALKGRTTFYAARAKYIIGRHYQHLRMHRIIMNVSANKQIDHRNHNGLDNRRNNLRVCTNTENKQNGLPYKNCSSQFRGVWWCKNVKKWRAAITVNKKLIYLGYRSSEIECAKLYDAKAKELFGEFANTNF